MAKFIGMLLFLPIFLSFSEINASDVTIGQEESKVDTLSERLDHLLVLNEKINTDLENARFHMDEVRSSFDEIRALIVKVDETLALDALIAKNEAEDVNNSNGVFFWAIILFFYNWETYTQAD